MYPKNTQQSEERENSRRGKNRVVAGDDDRPEQVAKETWIFIFLFSSPLRPTLLIYALLSLSASQRRCYISWKKKHKSYEKFHSFLLPYVAPFPSIELGTPLYLGINESKSFLHCRRLFLPLLFLFLWTSIMCVVFWVEVGWMMSCGHLTRINKLFRHKSVDWLKS